MQAQGSQAESSPIQDRDWRTIQILLTVKVYCVRSYSFRYLRRNIFKDIKADKFAISCWLAFNMLGYACSCMLVRLL
jgi:hypothetical protein